MPRSMTPSRRIGMLCLAGAVPLLATAAPVKEPLKEPMKQAVKAGLKSPPIIQTIQGVDTASCKPQATTKPCAYAVQLFVVNNNAGTTPQGCLAAMPYSGLSLVLNGTTAAGTITWSLPALAKLPAGAVSATFVKPGIQLTPAVTGGPLPSQLFSSGPTISPDGQSVSADIVAQPNGIIPLNHLPVVSMVLTTGKTVQCLGVDPIIINSES